MLSVGALIWVSLRPLLRLVLCTGFGFMITRADIFPVVASQGAGQVILNITGPCLMFSKIVPAFSTDNIGTLGPLFLVAFIYEGLGLLLAFIVKQFFWVPHRFRYGILVAGGWGNYGDIPTSVVMSITAGPPFNSTTDQTLAVAYISAFILVFYVTLFPMGGSRLIAWDHKGPDVEDDEVREAVRLRRKAFVQFWKWNPHFLRRRRQQSLEESTDSDSVQEKNVPATPVDVEADAELNAVPSMLLHRLPPNLEAPEGSFTPQLPSTPYEAGSPTPELMMSPVTSRAPTVTHVDTMTHAELHASSSDTHPKAVRFSENAPVSPRTKLPFRQRFRTNARSFMISLLSPPSMSIIISFVISLINPIKGLFVSVPGSHIPNAPDGQPPLAFVMDTATFVGAASVPLGLICLGSALARLKVPMSVTAWRAMPVGAISAFAVAKIALSPIIGVLICEGLTMAGVINRHDKVLRFVCIFFSCLPTATTQVYLTQVYSGTGSAEHVSAFLVPQYALMIIFMTILTAYSINLIF